MVTSQLTPELQHAVELANDQSPVTLIDPTTNCRYVLLREEVFERCRSLIGVEGFDPADFYAGQDKVAAIAWDHPDDAAYDNYNELTAK